MLSVVALIASFLIVTMPANSANAAFQTTGLIADWSGKQFVAGSNNWTDAVNGQTLTPSGALTTTNTSAQANVMTTNVDGRGAATFNNGYSVSQFYSITNPSLGLTNGMAQSLSVFLWMKASGTYNSSIPVFFQSQPTVSTWNNIAQFGIGSGGGLFLNANNDSAAAVYAGAPGEYSNVTPSVTDSKWHYVGFVRYASGGGEATDLYIDGVKKYTQTTSAALSRTALSYISVGSSAGQWDPYTGSMTDLDVWNTALTSTDVMNNYLDKVDDFYPPTAITSLSNSTQSANTGTPIASAVPTLAPFVTGSNAAPTIFSISPALPAGLNFDTTTGTISGTPTDISSTRSYTVTAATNMGTSTATFTLGVTAVGGVTVSFVSPPTSRSFAQKATFTASTNSGGTVTFYANNKKMFGCVNVKVTSFSATCNWTPNLRGTVNITAVFTTSDGSTTTSTPISYLNISARRTARGG